MANRFFSEKGGVKVTKRSMREATMPFSEKPAFPSADLPGKTQPKDRSGGVKRVKTHPKSQGL